MFATNVNLVILMAFAHEHWFHYVRIAGCHFDVKRSWKEHNALFAGIFKIDL